MDPATLTPLLNIRRELLTTMEAQLVWNVRTVSLQSSLRLRRTMMGMSVLEVVVVITVRNTVGEVHPKAFGAARMTMGVCSLLVVVTTVRITLTPLVPNVLTVQRPPRVLSTKLPAAIKDTAKFLKMPFLLKSAKRPMTYFHHRQLWSTR